NGGRERGVFPSEAARDPAQVSESVSVGPGRERPSSCSLRRRVGSEVAMSKTLGRRSALQTLLVGTSTLAFARLLDACSDASSPDRMPGPGAQPPGATPPPTDGDEYVPGQGNPVDTGATPPMVPNAEWEARAKQLEQAQNDQFGSTFTLTSAGPFVGKER